MRPARLAPLVVLVGCFSSTEPIEEGDATAASTEPTGGSDAGTGGTASTSTGATATATTDATATGADAEATGATSVTPTDESTGSQSSGVSCAQQFIDFEQMLANGLCELDDPDFGGVAIDGVHFIHDLPDVCLFPAAGAFSSRFVELLASSDPNSMGGEDLTEARIEFPAPVTDVSMWIGRKAGDATYEFTVDGVVVGAYDASSFEQVAFAQPGPLSTIWITRQSGADAFIGIDDLSFCM